MESTQKKLYEIEDYVEDTYKNNSDEEMQDEEDKQKDDIEEDVKIDYSTYNLKLAKNNYISCLEGLFHIFESLIQRNKRKLYWIL